jgi:hypothetical protein
MGVVHNMKKNIIPAIDGGSIRREKIKHMHIGQILWKRR